MKLLITGALGFIANNFLRSLRNSTTPIITVDKDHPTKWNTDLGDFYQIDISDGYPSQLDGQSVTTVVHFAAQSHVDNSIELPNDCVRNNVMATQYMLEYARRNNCRFLHISTDEVFGEIEDPDNDPMFDVLSPYRPNSPYSASKAASDHLVRAYRQTYGLDTLTLNCTNNYGPYQKAEKFIPKTIKSLIEKNPIRVYGDGTNVRDWIHVDDFCIAIWTALNARWTEPQLVVGAIEPRTNVQMVHTLIKHYETLTGYRNLESLITYVKDRPGHDFCYMVDNQYTQFHLTWKPLRSLERDMSSVVRWYCNNSEWLYE